MKVFRHVDSLVRETVPIALAIGFFDGVHRGHQRILEQARAAALAQAGAVWVLSFDVHPRRVVGGAPPPLLTCNRHKIMLLRRYGADGCLMLPFTQELAATEPGAFLEHLLASAPRLHAITVGADWRFGQGAGGDVGLLRRLCAPRRVRVLPVDPLLQDGVPVSSTRIRAVVAQGRLHEAQALLGRPFSILGSVVPGRGLGRGLGFPTANLECGNEAVPPQGVYAVYAAVQGGIHDGVLSFGTRPTMGGDPDHPVLELHLPGVAADLYNQDIEVFFVARLREQRRFDTPGLLRLSMAEDVERATRMLRESAQKEWLYSHCFGVL